ncbi:hypothetical protein AB0C12_15880 [Actinoplanes sp. NPDC048967]|uniref:hypothetical protein n=1 Tax=Actinoplanes sp. NPDC048967 TaxID=3155269 RepID=UPI0033E99050
MTKTSATNAGRVKKPVTAAAARTATAGNSRLSGNGRVSTVAGSARKATAKR